MRERDRQTDRDRGREFPLRAVPGERGRGAEGQRGNTEGDECFIYNSHRLRVIN
jgi:hypothetical protein